MRMFLAIDIPAALREPLLQVQAKLAATRADVRWVAAENFHVTVKFLGEVEEAMVAALVPRVERAAAQVPSFDLEVEGIDRLPAKGPLRVIASRIHSPDQRMTRLHRLLDSAAGGMGLPLDTRVLVPHLTLGRARSNHGVNRLLRLAEKHNLDFFGSFPVEQVTLYRSELGGGAGGGSRYEVVSVGRLQARETDLASASRR